MRWIGSARVVTTAVVALGLTLSVTARTTADDAIGTAGAVKVTVKYTGKGDVDKTHNLWIWLFDTPDIGPGSFPIGELSLDRNGGAVTFNDVSAEKVWIAVAYDINGTMTGNGPPASGSPIAIHMEAGGPAPVSPGDKAEVTITFDDSQRMP